MGVDYVGRTEPRPAPPEEGDRATAAERPRRSRAVEPTGEDRFEGEGRGPGEGREPEEGSPEAEEQEPQGSAEESEEGVPDAEDGETEEPQGRRKRLDYQA